MNYFLRYKQGMVQAILLFSHPLNHEHIDGNYQNVKVRKSLSPVSNNLESAILNTLVTVCFIVSLKFIKYVLEIPKLA